MVSVASVQRIGEKCPVKEGVMRTILYGCLITMALVCHPFMARGDEQSHRKAAEHLLSVMEVEKSLPRLAAHLVESQLKHNPQLASQRDIFQQFFTKYLHWASVKEDTITAYTQAFTEPELKKLTEFYKTPLGKKASEKMPKLVFLAGQMGLQKAEANQAELRQMIEEKAGKQGGGGSSCSTMVLSSHLRWVLPQRDIGCQAWTPEDHAARTGRG
jgi:hypothetical protein